MSIYSNKAFDLGNLSQGALLRKDRCGYRRKVVLDQHVEQVSVVVLRSLTSVLSLGCFVDQRQTCRLPGHRSRRP